MESSTASSAAFDLQRAAVAIELARAKARREGLYWFIDRIFRFCFEPDEKFVTGDYIQKVAERFEKYHYTIDVTGRDHFKSTRLHAELMYAFFIDEGRGFEAHYFSYSYEMAAYQLKKLKGLIKSNPFFATIIDNKEQAESILSYSWEESKRPMSVTPQGMLSFSRGVHAERLYIDDCFKSEGETLIDPASVKKINDAMKSEILQMVKPGGYCRVVGTSMTPYDFYFDPGMQKQFNTWITPAIIDEQEKLTLWPEWWPYERLDNMRRSMNDIDKFNREFMALPASTSKSYIKRDNLYAVATATSMDFAPHPELEDEEVVGGYDIGKHLHPSYCALFTRKYAHEDDDGNEIYRYTQIFSKWLDGVDYTKQINFLNELCEYFYVDNLYYDNTRGEFESFEEQDQLDKALTPMSMAGGRKKNITGARFQGLVNQGLIEIVNEPRTLNHILLVNGDLNSPEIRGKEGGHGDSFWGCALGVWVPERKMPQVWNMYRDDTDTPSAEGTTQERDKTWANSTPTQYEDRRFFV